MLFVIRLFHGEAILINKKVVDGLIRIKEKIVIGLQFPFSNGTAKCGMSSDGEVKLTVTGISYFPEGGDPVLLQTIA